MKEDREAIPFTSQGWLKRYRDGEGKPYILRGTVIIQKAIVVCLILVIIYYVTVFSRIAHRVYCSDGALLADGEYGSL